MVKKEFLTLKISDIIPYDNTGDKPQLVRVAAE